jgi:hypothetical protein
MNGRRNSPYTGFQEGWVLWWCIENTFRTIPPELDRVPTSYQTQDVAIQVQAFIFNLFGCLDNLAWVWVLERNIDKMPDRKPLRRENIDLQWLKANNFLTQELARLTDECSNWFAYLKDYRHALAHRIPLYVVPFMISPDNASIFSELDRSLFDRLAARRSKAEIQAKQRERDSLRHFQPIITHSSTEKASRPIVFHTQILTDFKTIELIGAKLLDELRGAP